MRLSKESLVTPRRLIAATVVAGALVACGGAKEEPKNVEYGDTIDCADTIKAKSHYMEVFLPQNHEIKIFGKEITSLGGGAFAMSDDKQGISIIPKGSEIDMLLYSKETIGGYRKAAEITIKPEERSEESGVNLSIQLLCGKG